jgi:hypothetical protein
MPVMLAMPSAAETLIADDAEMQTHCNAGDAECSVSNDWFLIYETALVNEFPVELIIITWFLV